MKKILKEDVDITPEESLDARVLAFLSKADRLGTDDEVARDPLNMSDVKESIRLKSMKILLEEESLVKDDVGTDVNTFTSEISRLIQHADTLLDIKGTIITMAQNYLTKAYDKNVGDQFVEILERDYNLSKEVVSTDEPNNNFAVGARQTQA